MLLIHKESNDDAIVVVAFHRIRVSQVPEMNHLLACKSYVPGTGMLYLIAFVEFTFVNPAVANYRLPS
jgi:hypothetical protein